MHWFKRRRQGVTNTFVHLLYVYSQLTETYDSVENIREEPALLTRRGEAQPDQRIRSLYIF